MPAGTAPDPPGQCAVLTIGHSTRPIEDFVELLKRHGVTQLVDVRTVPRSRHNPQFNQEALQSALSGAYSPYAQRPADRLMRRAFAINGAASRVAVCIGR